jgi:hypothetical protein
MGIVAPGGQLLLLLGSILMCTWLKVTFWDNHIRVPYERLSLSAYGQLGKMEIVA